jgi:hypothetical protein
MLPRLATRPGVWLPALALASGCSWFSSTVEVYVRTPAPPQPWREAFPELFFELSCPEADPDTARCFVEPCSQVSLRLPKRANWPVLAFPWVRGARLAPAGGLYPQDLDLGGDCLQLRWEHGSAAEVFQALIREGFEVGRVNARRLVEEMLACSAGDPCRLDLPALAAQLASDEFRVTDIRLLPARDVALEIGPGTWLLESPFRPAQRIAAGEALRIPALSLGAHRLFAVEPPAGFALYVTEREVLLLPLEEG